MSAERKKLLWISISACVFVLIILAVGSFLLSGKKGGEQAPATIGNSAPPKAQDPHDFLSAPPPVPSPEQQPAPSKDGNGNVIIIYGDKPTAPVAGQGASGATAGGAAGTAAGAAGTAAAGSGEAAAAPGTSGASSEGAAAKAPGAAKPKKPAAATTAAAAKPAAKPAPAKAPEYWIQAGSFASRGRADELKQSLAEKGVAALIVVKDISGKSYYRVRVGPYAVKAEADDWLARLKAIPGCDQAYVSKNVPPKPKK